MSRMEDRARNAPTAVGQEAIVMTSEDRYLETLEQMLRAAELRNDPTLAIAVSPKMLRLLLTALAAARADALAEIRAGVEGLETGAHWDLGSECVSRVAVLALLDPPK